MSFEMKKDILSTEECSGKIKAEQNIETELNLPDYCAEIKRILKCTLTPGIHSVSRTGDRVSARGTVLIRVIYLGEKDKIDCYEKNVDLALSSQMKDITDDMVITAKALTNYVNCRAASQRKITVGSSVSVEFSAIQLRKRELPCEITDETVQIKTEKIKAENFICISEKTFDLDETVALTKEKASIAKVIRQNAYVILESKKAVSGKLLIKGELIAEIMYCPQDSENKFELFRHSMPISQIIDVEGVDENMDCTVKCKPSQLIVSVKNDSDGTGRLVEFAARVTAYVSCSKVREYELIKDCYCTEGEIEEEYATVDMLCPVNTAEKTESVKESIDLGASVKEICDVWVSDTKTHMRGEKNKAKGTCTVTACILYLDEKGNPSYNEKELEFFSEVGLTEDYESVQCDFDATVRKVSFSPVQKGKTEISLEVAVCIKICSVSSMRILTDVRKGDNKSENRPALTLYYCSKGEKVWDIAKRYRTTSQAVMEENGIDGESVMQDMMLLIPCV